MDSEDNFSEQNKKKELLFKIDLLRRQGYDSVFHKYFSMEDDINEIKFALQVALIRIEQRENNLKQINIMRDMIKIFKFIKEKN